MGKNRNYIIISTVVVAFLAGTLVSGPQASAASPVLTFLENTVMPKLDAILVAITGIDTTQVGLNSDTQTQVDNIQSRLSSIEIQLDEIQSVITPVDADGDGSVFGVDCDDNNPDVFEDMTYYGDFDSDGYGNPFTSQIFCEPLGNYVLDDDDCNDDVDTIYPGALEVNDGVDNDCDGLVDEGILVDLDSDGFFNDVDCDDTNPAIGAETIFYLDADQDGYGGFDNTQISCDVPVDYVLDNSDCDDARVNVYPGATEIADGLDNDCDGLVDEGLHPLVINEILFDGAVDGDPNCDGVTDALDDEFVEIVNVGALSIDLSGFTLFENDFSFSPRHTFASGTILNSGSVIVVYGGGTPSCSLPANVMSNVASSGTLGLNNDGDTITLRDSSGNLKDEHTWTGGGFDTSIVRSPEFTFSASFVDHYTVSGLDYSPGTDAFGNVISIP